MIVINLPYSTTPYAALQVATPFSPPPLLSSPSRSVNFCRVQSTVRREGERTECAVAGTWSLIPAYRQRGRNRLEIATDCRLTLWSLWRLWRLWSLSYEMNEMNEMRWTPCPNPPKSSLILPNPSSPPCSYYPMPDATLSWYIFPPSYSMESILTFPSSIPPSRISISQSQSQSQSIHPSINPSNPHSPS